MESIGDKIRETRKSKGLTQEQLAELSQRNLRTIQRIENGENIPRGETLQFICRVLEISLEEIPNETRQRRLLNLIPQIIFLLTLNIALMLLTGYLTLNHEATMPSKVAAHLLSFFIPLFIALLTSKMNGLERMLKFGTGYIAYFFITITGNLPFPDVFLSGFYTSLIISLAVLYYGNTLIKVFKL